MLERFPCGIVCLDLGLDPSTPSGEFTATIIAAVAQMERRLIGQRTRDALAAKRAQGIQLGRPREMSTDALERIRELNSAGYCVAEIARLLNAESVPTARAGKWHSPGAKRALTWIASGAA